MTLRLSPQATGRIESPVSEIRNTIEDKDLEFDLDIIEILNSS